MQAALKSFGQKIDAHVQKYVNDIKDAEIRQSLQDVMTQQTALDIELTPYKFHVSEDIYTSIVLHSDTTRLWRSVLHPEVECKMLSPQDLHSWMVQRFKYAGGTLDIALHDNPVFMPGMSFPQRVMYASTIWSYLGGLWNFVFLTSPIIFLFTGIAPVNAYSMAFFAHFLPFIFFNELSTMVGTWGIAGFKSKANYLSFFPVNLKAIWVVLKGEQIKFPTTPKDRQTGNFLHHVIPQLSIVVLTLLGILYAGIRYSLDYNTNLIGLITNSFWGINNIATMYAFIMSAFWQPDE